MLHVEQVFILLVLILDSQASVASNHIALASHDQPEAAAVRGGTGSLPVSLRGGLVISRTDQGGTACQCMCGDRVAWHRLIFPGNVEKLKEWECKHEVCPNIIIPGMRVRADCTFVEDLAELIAGTVCTCQCGDKMAWRNQAFYGNVSEEKEEYCLKELCPRINPLPGLRHRAQCHFDPKLFSFPMPLTTSPPSVRAGASCRASFVVVSMSPMLLWFAGVIL